MSSGCHAMQAQSIGVLLHLNFYCSRILDVDTMEQAERFCDRKWKALMAAVDEQKGIFTEEQFRQLVEAEFESIRMWPLASWGFLFTLQTDFTNGFAIEFP